MNTPEPEPLKNTTTLSTVQYPRPLPVTFHSIRNVVRSQEKPGSKHRVSWFRHAEVEHRIAVEMLARGKVRRRMRVGIQDSRIQDSGETSNTTREDSSPKTDIARLNITTQIVAETLHKTGKSLPQSQHKLLLRHCTKQVNLFPNHITIAAETLHKTGKSLL